MAFKGLYRLLMFRNWARFAPLPTFASNAPQLYPPMAGNQGRLTTGRGEERCPGTYVRRGRFIPDRKTSEKEGEFAVRTGGLPQVAKQPGEVRKLVMSI